MRHAPDPNTRLGTRQGMIYHHEERRGLRHILPQDLRRNQPRLQCCVTFLLKEEIQGSYFFMI